MRAGRGFGLAVGLAEAAGAGSRRDNPSGWFNFERCPLCGKEGYRFGIHAGWGRWLCFRCGSGTVRDLVRRLREAGHGEAGARSASPVAQAPGGARRGAGVLPEGFVSVSSRAGPAGARRLAVRYLEARGVSETLAAEVGAGFCAGGRYGMRVVLPVEGEGGEVVWFAARDFTGRARERWLFPPGPRPDVVYNIGRAKGEVLVVVEGPFAALPVGGAALLGKRLSRGQAEIVRAAGRSRVAVIFDEGAGPEAAAAGEMLLAVGCRGVVAGALARGQPDDYEPWEIMRLADLLPGVSPFDRVAAAWAGGLRHGS